MIMGNDKMIFFVPGETVQIKQEIDYRPVMVVKEVNKMKTRNEEKSQLLGITCFWFTVHGEYAEARFNTKDLEHTDPQ